MKIQRTFDGDFVANCYQSAWDKIGDDETRSQSIFFPDMSAAHYWLEVEDNGEKLGIFLARQMNKVCYEGHIVLLPSAFGQSGEAAKLAVNWMFENTDCQRIIGCIPAYNTPAINVAKKAGMKQFGINEKSFMKDGILFDQVYLGISRG